MADNTPQATDRNARQRAIVPDAALAASDAVVVGVGAIGRQVALQLAAIGVPSLTLVDFDTVETVNLGPQGYFESDVGKAKVAATAALCMRVNPNIKITPVNARFTVDDPQIPRAVFSCVDSMDARSFIYNGLLRREDNVVDGKHRFFCDGRMAAEVLRVITACDADSWDYYRYSLFESHEAFTGSCTAKSTIFCSNVAAGFMVQAFTKWLRGFPVDNDFLLNMLALELQLRDERKEAMKARAASAA